MPDVEISLLKISSRTFQKDCFGLVLQAETEKQIHKSCLFPVPAFFFLRLFNPSHTTVLRKSKQITKMSNETGLQNDSSLFVC